MQTLRNPGAPDVRSCTLQTEATRGKNKALLGAGQQMPRVHDDDDVVLNVIGCRVDILGTNCDQCVCMVQCCFTSTRTINDRLIRTGGPGAQDGHHDFHTAPELCHEFKVPNTV